MNINLCGYYTLNKSNGHCFFECKTTPYHDRITIWLSFGKCLYIVKIMLSMSKQSYLSELNFFMTENTMFFPSKSIVMHFLTNFTFSFLCCFESKKAILILHTECLYDLLKHCKQFNLYTVNLNFCEFHQTITFLNMLDGLLVFFKEHLLIHVYQHVFLCWWNKSWWHIDLHSFSRVFLKIFFLI